MPTKPQKSWPPEDGDITHLIERLDALEERNNIRFEALFAKFYVTTEGYHYVRLCGEAHPRDGLELGQHLKVAITLYDPKGRVGSTGACYLSAPDKFYGFEAFQLDINAIGEVVKIRVYPQRA
jgi:hypothetical protein